MEIVKKIYEEPTIQKVKFDYKTRIADSSCSTPFDVQASECHFEP